MKLADEIFITVDGERIYLRPTLKAAMRLNKRYGGFEPIVKAIAEQSLSVMADVVRQTAERPCDLLTHANNQPLVLQTGALVEPLISVVLAMTGVDPDEETKESEGANSSPGVSFEEHYEHLYQLATGWLGYAPDVALNSTPAEIIEAYKGRVEMLRAIFGSASDDDDEAKSETISHKDVKAGIAALRGLASQRVGDVVRIY